jgi:hypothetical protein
LSRLNRRIWFQAQFHIYHSKHNFSTKQYIREWPFHLKGGLWFFSKNTLWNEYLGTDHLTWRRGGYGFLYRSEKKFRTTQELEYYFFLSRKVQFFFPEFYIRLREWPFHLKGGLWFFSKKIFWFPMLLKKIFGFWWRKKNNNLIQSFCHIT